MVPRWLKFVGTAAVSAVAGAVAMGFMIRAHILKQRAEEEAGRSSHERDLEIYYRTLAASSNVMPCRVFPETLVHLCGYDPTSPQLPSLISFQPLKRNVDCVFAKGSKAWGSAPWNDMMSLEDNVRSSLLAFNFFLTMQRGIDAFVFHIPTEGCGDTLETFSETVRRVLQALSDCDPERFHCMDKSYINKKGWVFRFCHEEAFVTSFGKCYPPTSSRYSHGAEGVFILFQPYTSFVTHDLGPDLPETNWDNPKSNREKTRVRFRNNGRPYLIRDTLVFPIVEDIVKPLNFEDPPPEWWRKPVCPFKQ